MKVYFNGQLVAQNTNTFKDKKDGSEISYTVNTLLDIEGGVLIANSKEPINYPLNTPATFTLELRQDAANPKLYKPSLKAINPIGEVEAIGTVE